MWTEDLFNICQFHSSHEDSIDLLGSHIGALALFFLCLVYFSKEHTSLPVSQSLFNQAEATNY